MPLTEAQMMGDAIEGATGIRGFRLDLWPSAGMRLIGLALALVSVCGAVSYAARQRREIAIRMALGADPREVVRLVLGRGAALVACGVLAGLGGAWVLPPAWRTACPPRSSPPPLCSSPRPPSWPSRYGPALSPPAARLVWLR